jgi:defect-in-organelle-trafficking protein DotB
MSSFEPYNLEYGFGLRDLHAFLVWARSIDASDLNIQSGDFIFGYVSRRWQAITSRRLEGSEIEHILDLKYGPTAVTVLDKGEKLDWRMEAAIDRDNVMAFRANAVRSRVGAVQRGISITLRGIPGLPPKMEKLNFDPRLVKHLFPEKGLTMWIGVTGSGKSTSMGAVNRARLENPAKPVKIITYEDPVEFVFDGLASGNMPEPSQVELGPGRDLEKFSDAVSTAMRRKADVIVMGEMRDHESINLAITLADTGHAVSATVHSEDPATALGRIINEYEPSQQPSIASGLRANLHLGIGQKIRVRTDGVVRAYRSWLLFDNECRRIMGTNPSDRWEVLLRDLMDERGTTYAHDGLPDVWAGKLDLERFMSIAGCTEEEARAFLLREGRKLLASDQGANVDVVGVLRQMGVDTGVDTGVGASEVEGVAA